MGSNVVPGSRGKPRASKAPSVALEASKGAPPADVAPEPTDSPVSVPDALPAIRPRPMTGLVPQAHGGALAPAWPKGVSGNPGGRARTVRISDYVAQCLGMSVGELRKPASLDEPSGMAAARAWVLAGLDGDVRALETMADRAEGKATQRVEVDHGVKAYDVTTSPDDR